MPQATYVRMKKFVHCTLKHGDALYYGTGLTHERALADARQARDRAASQPQISRPAVRIPGWTAAKCNR